MKRKNTQLEALQREYEHLQATSEKLTGALREFHSGAVNPLTVARVTSDLLAGSVALSDSDRENVIEIKRHLDQLLQVLRRLSTWFAELS